MAEKRICSVSGCGKRHEARGFCTRHFQRWRKYGSTELPSRPTSCSVKGCVRPHCLAGYCRAHWTRWKKYGDPNAGKILRGVGQLFFEQAMAYKGDDCCLWPYGKDARGYPVVYINGLNQVANRLVCKLTHGDAPSPLHQAAHECGVPLCINPRHLSWKTRSENMQDKVRHGTHCRGERNWCAKLTEANVIKIRALRGKMMQKDIAKMFGVAKTTISGIHRGATWKWL